MKDGIHIKSAHIIAFGIFAVVMLPSAWVGFKLGRATAGPDEKPESFADNVRRMADRVKKKVAP